MKVNYKRLVLWLILCIVWCGGILVVDYAVGQHYGKNVAPAQFDNDTTAYKELKTQKAVEKTINLSGLVGGIFCLVMASRAFKLPKEKK